MARRDVSLANTCTRLNAVPSCAGAARAEVNKSLPFVLENDFTYVIHCHATSGSSASAEQTPTVSKTLRTIADLACHACSQSGVTELSVTDHALEQIVEASAFCLLSKLSFRYLAEWTADSVSLQSDTGCPGELLPAQGLLGQAC